MQNIQFPITVELAGDSIWDYEGPMAVTVHNIVDEGTFDEEEYPNYYRIEKSEPLQAYWPWSWPMIAMIKLYRFTGRKEFLDGAMRIYDFFSSCHEDAFHSPGAGKNSWASSMLYNITGDERYRKTTMSQMEFILESQQPDGFMLKPDCSSFDDQPIRISYDFTPDYATWLVECAQELSSR